jgi:hypothetical protein
MIAFSPEITIEIGSITSICCSIICVIALYYMYRQSKQKNADMYDRIDKLSDAFCKLTEAILEDLDNENESRQNAGGDLDYTLRPDPVLLGMRGPRTSDSDTTSYDFKGNSDREMPDVSTDM